MEEGKRQGGGRQLGLSSTKLLPPKSYRAIKVCPTTAAGGLFLVHGFVTGIHSSPPLAIWHYQFRSLWRSLSP